MKGRPQFVDWSLLMRSTLLFRQSNVNQVSGLSVVVNQFREIRFGHVQIVG